MPDRAFLSRLRSSGGPSLHLLVLLDQHRVMTTDQLARATGTPERTVRYRLARLHESNLVDTTRPGRESGSAPQHWWLRPAGAKLVTGAAPAEGRPSGMFVAHAAAITEVWLALTEQADTSGVRVEHWLTDRAGWLEWEAGAQSRRYRLTPDAVTQLRLGGGPAVPVLIEVDLASMTQTLLRQKVERYLTYAADGGWWDHYDQCPPMLLLTTTPTRAANFARAAAPLLARHTREYGSEDPAETPLVAACGLVHAPARAVVELCWTLPDPGAAELTMAEILTDCRRRLDESQAWHHTQNTVVRRRDDLDTLDDVLRRATPAGLGDWLGSEQAAAVLITVAGPDNAAFLDSEPDLARQVIAWGRAQRKVGNKWDARALAEPFVNQLADRYQPLWAAQAQRLLAAGEHLAAGTPAVYTLASTLAAGRLANHKQMAVLDAPAGNSHRQLQEAAWGDYLQRRQASVETTWRRLDRRSRRTTTVQRWAEQYDTDSLVVCPDCLISYPQPEWGATYSERCPHCGGVLRDWPGSDGIIMLATRLQSIRDRLGTRLSRIAPTNRQECNA